jgi:hypothetical protein
MNTHQWVNQVLLVKLYHQKVLLIKLTHNLHQLHYQAKIHSQCRCDHDGRRYGLNLATPMIPNQGSGHSYCSNLTTCALYIPM